MVITFDFLYRVWQNEDILHQIEECMKSSHDCSLDIRESGVRLSFYPEENTVIVDYVLDDKPAKFIPARVTYHLLDAMIYNKDDEQIERD